MNSRKRKILFSGIDVLAVFKYITVDLISALIAYWPLNETSDVLANVISNAVSVGRNICVNGTFASGSSWELGSGWSITGGKGVASSAVVNQTLSISIGSIPMTLGKTYRIQYDVVVTSGSVKVQAGSGTSGTTRSASGTYSEDLLCAGSQTIIFNPVTTFTGNIDNVIVQELNIPASTIKSTTNIAPDGDMELAGVTNWTPQNSAVITKETTSPQSGSQWLKIAYGGVANPRAATNSILTIGKTYRITGYGRGDGTVAPLFSDSINVLWTGTNSTNWQAFDVIFTTASTQMRFQPNAPSTGNFAGFDSIVIYEINEMTGKTASTVLIGQSAPLKLGGKSYKFNGSTDYVNIYSKTLNSVISPDEGTFLVFFQMSNSSHLTDGLAHVFAKFSADGNNIIHLAKDTTNNQLVGKYQVGGTNKNAVSGAIFTSLDWNMLAMTYSKGADQLKLFLNGTQVGSTITGLGTWAGNVSSTLAAIGASNVTPTLQFEGSISNVAMFNRVLTAIELLTLAKKAGLA